MAKRFPDSRMLTTQRTHWRSRVPEPQLETKQILIRLRRTLPEITRLLESDGIPYQLIQAHNQIKSLCNSLNLSDPYQKETWNEFQASPAFAIANSLPEEFIRKYQEKYGGIR